MSEHQASTGRGHDLPDQPAYPSPGSAPAEPGRPTSAPGGPYPPPPANWPDQAGWQRPTSGPQPSHAAPPQAPPPQHNPYSTGQLPTVPQASYTPPPYG